MLFLKQFQCGLIDKTCPFLSLLRKIIELSFLCLSPLFLFWSWCSQRAEGWGWGGHSLFREITLIEQKDVQNIGKKGTLMVATVVHGSRGLTVCDNISR